MKNEPNQKQLTPPYIGVAWLEKMVVLLGKKSYDEVGATLFQANNFSKIDAQLAVSALKFMRFVDENGKATEHMGALRFEGEKKTGMLKPIVESAYAPLFSNVDEPQNASTVALTNSFKALYPKLSDRVIRSAIPVFLKWCEYGGLREAGTVRSWTLDKKRPANPDKGERVKVKHTQKIAPSDTPDTPAGSHVLPIIKGKVGIFIPEEWNTNTQLDDDLPLLWSSAVKALNAYAQKYQSKHQAPNSEEVGT